jgi:hypothetical protein
MPRVTVSGAPSFDLPNASYAALNLAPGARRVDVNWGRNSQIGPDTASLNLEAGRTYYVQVTSATHDGAVGSAAVFYMTGKSAAKVVERDEAMKALPKTKSVF